MARPADDPWKLWLSLGNASVTHYPRFKIVIARSRSPSSELLITFYGERAPKEMILEIDMNLSCKNWPHSGGVWGKTSMLTHV